MNAMKNANALLLVDVQNDFCPGGAVGVAEGDAVIPVLNRWIAHAVDLGVPVYASRDWHPLSHISFTEHGGPWPEHCLQDTEGAAFHPGLELPEHVIKVTKGVRFDQDQCSAFDQTGLAEQLRKDNVQLIWIGGLAEDDSVLATALDARREGFEVVLLDNATRPLTPEGGKKARQTMREAGVEISGEISGEISE